MELFLFFTDAYITSYGHFMCCYASYILGLYWLYCYNGLYLNSFIYLSINTNSGCLV